MDGAPDPDQFWAKLRYRNDDRSTGEVVNWHPLVAHSADVAAVLERLLRHTQIGARIARLMGQDQLSHVQIQRLCVLAVLHDAGKVNPWFQNKASGSGRTEGHITPVVHMMNGPDLWERLSATMELHRLYPWFGDMWDAMDWLQVTWSHHGQPVKVEQPAKDLWPNDSRQRLSAVSRWAQQWYDDAYKDAEPFAADPVQHVFNGALTLADWMASDRDLFEFTPDCTDPGDAMDAAERRAQFALTETDLFPNRDVDPSLATVLGGFEPYEVQEAVHALPTHPEGTLTILESATGSGKTEAALGRYARLLDEGLVDSMFFAVPTRAAATQLHGRIQEVRDRIFDGEGPPVHLAVPGYLKVDDVTGKREKETSGWWTVRWDEDVGPRGWAAESSKRYTSSPIAVGTVDQVLMAALRRKHAHLRLAGLSRSLLVVDEVHASSTYMNELLHSALSFHKRMGGHALLMSATLGSEARATFTGDDAPELEEAKDEHYPLVSHVNGPDVLPPKKPSPPDGREKTVGIALSDAMDAPSRIAQYAETAAAQGAHVLIIRNTVAACQDLFNEIDDRFALRVETESGAVAVPHHSRYCAADREQLDRRIQEVYGKHEVEKDGETRIVRKTDGHVITVATQTVEQSLDIDADVLITDLCPMDVLLQRIGRLHRHPREGRPTEYRDAQCTILTPAVRDLKASISSESGKGYPGPGLGSVYGDLRVIEATWRALEKRTKEKKPLSIPRDNRTLVEEATHTDVLDAITAEPDWKAHEQVVNQMARAETQDARNNRLHPDEQLIARANTFPDERPPTRLGDDGIVVALPEAMTSPLGHSVDELTLSPYLFERGQRPPNGSATDVEQDSDGFKFQFGGEWFRYDAVGIRST